MANWVQTLTGETQARLLVLLRRTPHTINELAAALGLTDNAVRTHIAALSRDGIVTDVGTQRDTGGKPARRYGLTAEAEDLFPKAYAAVLNGVIAEVVRKEGRESALRLLRAVGKQLAAGVAPAASAEARVASAAAVLRSLGGDVEVERTDTGWRLQGYACALSSVAREHAEACALAQALVASITGCSVTEACERGERPRCAFLVEDGAKGRGVVPARRKRAS